jgi:hypothetical protein
MRTKIIAGNLIIVLLMGLLSWVVVRAQVQAELLGAVDSGIVDDARLVERAWRLSALQYLGQAEDRARQRNVRQVFRAPNEQARVSRAAEATNAIRGWFGDPERGRAGPPDVVAITDDTGRVIARDTDPGRLSVNLTESLPSLRRVLESGQRVHDVWRFTYGQERVLQTAMAPIRSDEGVVLGALIVGYDLSTGSARSLAEGLSGRELAFLVHEADEVEVYASTFEQQASALGAAMAERDLQSMTSPTLLTLDGVGYASVAGPLPYVETGDVSYLVMANRSEAQAKASMVAPILWLTGVAILAVLIYGFLVGTSFLRPIEEMEEGILAIINGNTELRLDIDSRELGGLAYRINQLVNVFTDTPESDSEGRISSPLALRPGAARRRPSRRRPRRARRAPGTTTRWRRASPGSRRRRTSPASTPSTSRPSGPWAKTFRTSLSTSSCSAYRPTRRACFGSTVAAWCASR